ncbi:hypothetical protein C4D60_Mb03t06660 [Musa balbisiana]|uniref:Uncharacterized protein n=1 Tax=Musa balbisiana TaxID=52838 RepID=A0A4S8J805_MUSBA|nr:hypothetical protein C4D60_Mb03t06660 [Musa balbisiana]
MALSRRGGPQPVVTAIHFKWPAGVCDKEEETNNNNNNNNKGTFTSILIMTKVFLLENLDDMLLVTRQPYHHSYSSGMQHPTPHWGFVVHRKPMD